ncbi:MAG: DUF1446 domain-containing protein [Deltaproteobacteria bacterium]|nr:DUF1446 domain-containing protein [Deltaproteobacteria bacterium]
MKSGKTVRIGGACGFLGDTSISTPQLISGGNVDYIVYDYLAEVTMSLLARVKAKRPDMGYAHYFTDVIITENIREIAKQGIRIVSNAGGVNPGACRDKVLEIAKKAGIELKVAVIQGDDLMPRLEELKQKNITEMYTGEHWPDGMMSINAYLGARPIADALAAGADIVITGRVVDSALTLGPLMNEFGWPDEEYDLLAQGSLAGHIIECGAQATGGLHTDWELVPDWTNIGYPVVECYSDGSFLVTKPPETGGLVNPATVGEQLLYEIGDPQAYFLPDVVCDFSQVNIEQTDIDTVRVTGAIGRPPTDTYKVYAAYHDGYRCIAVLPVIGFDAARKAERQSKAVIERMQSIFRQKNLGDYRDTLIESMGAESSYGPHSKSRETREVACKISVEHDKREALEIFAREVYAPTTSMSPGSTGWFTGRPAVAPVIKLFSFLISKKELPVAVIVGKEAKPVDVRIEGGFNPDKIVRPDVPEAIRVDGDMDTVPLIHLAWGRSGDKGNSCNIGIIARKAKYLPYIRSALTEAAVQYYMAHVFEGAVNPKVERFELPGINALNFLLHESLGGGQMASLRMDPLAKGMAQQLLDFPIPISAGVLEKV